jgi:hypothetical protein
MVKRILHGLTLDKIAAVDRPCQEGALMTIMKRAAIAIEDAPLIAFYKGKYSADDRRDMMAKGQALSDGTFPIKDAADLEKALEAVGRGAATPPIRAHIKVCAKALGLADQIPDGWKAAKVLKALRDELVKGGVLEADADDGAQSFDAVMDEQAIARQIWDKFYQATDALRESICSILQDPAVTDKNALVRESVKEFTDFLTGEIPGDVGKSLAAGFAAVFAGTSGHGDTNMKTIAKALGLPETATEAEICAKLAANELAVKFATDVAKMSGKHKSFMDNEKAKMPKGGKEAFAGMSADERDAHIKANPADGDDGDTEKMLAKGDAFRTADGVIMTKRDFGTDAGFLFAKGQASKLAEQGVELAKAAEARDVATFAKRAATLGFAEGFGEVLRKAYKGDADSIAKLEAEVAGMRKQLETGELYKSFGADVTGAGSAEGSFMAKVEEVKKANPKLSDQQAYAKAYKDPANAELRTKMLEEQRAN